MRRGVVASEIMVRITKPGALFLFHADGRWHLHDATRSGRVLFWGGISGGNAIAWKKETLKPDKYKLYKTDGVLSRCSKLVYIELSYYFVPTVVLKKERSGLRD